MRYARPSDSHSSAGTGFRSRRKHRLFLQPGHEYYGTEGSESAVRRVGQRFANQLAFRSLVAISPSTFLSMGRSTGRRSKLLTHNSTAASDHAPRRCLAHEAGARFIGIDWFRPTTRDFGRTRSGRLPYPIRLQLGSLQDVGVVHFPMRDI